MPKVKKLQASLFPDATDMMIKTAEFSPDRLYRYNLFRLWDNTKPYVLFICLNPSTADETTDDRTVSRCIDFSRRWGYGGFCMANLFAYRATKPCDMKAHPEPVGEKNDWWLDQLTRGAGLVVCAWGTHGTHLKRDREVLWNLHIDVKLYYLKLTKEGHPEHPLYQPKDRKPIEWKL